MMVTNVMAKNGKQNNNNNKIRNKKNGATIQVNQQNHMVANKFDPRMDPVVVQVQTVIIIIIIIIVVVVVTRPRPRHGRFKLKCGFQ